MNKPVDNRRRMRITTRFLWISSWIAGKPEMAGSGLLRGARRSSRNVLTVRKRAPPGGDPGNAGGAGRPVPRTGTWPRRAARGAGKAGQLASRCGEAGQGPSISYMEGPCLILPGRNAIPSTSTGAGTPRRRPPECATAMIRGHDRGRARSLSGCAATEGRQAQRQQACKPAASATRLRAGSTGVFAAGRGAGSAGRRPVSRLPARRQDCRPAVCAQACGSLV